MSNTACLYSIAGAISKGQQEFCEGNNWLPVNKEQGHFLADYYPQLVGVIDVIPEIESRASKRIEDITRFLQEKGFSIELEPLSDPTSVAIASVLDMLCLWQRKGERTYITRDNQRYDAVSLEEGLKFYRSEDYPYTICGITCQNSDKVFICIADRQQEGFDLLGMVQSLSAYKRQDAKVPGESSGSRMNYYYSWVEFPMVTLDQRVDISWLNGILCPTNSGPPIVIGQAIQQNKLRINEEGARVQSATAMEMVLTASPDPAKKPLIIDQPFFFWVERGGLPIPLFAAYITEEDWKDPKDIRST